MKARIKWVQDRTFIGQSGSGHGVVMSTTVGPSPMEMVLIGLGGCTAFDVVQILDRSRENIEDCVAEIEAERAPDDPQVFTRIHVHWVVTGRGVSRSKVERAIKLSAEKYCSASAMLEKTADITHDFEIIDTADR